MSPRPPIFSMFGRSPIRPLQTHMAKAHTCAQTLLPFFTAVFAANWEEAKLLQGQIANLEKDADQLKKDFRLHLPKDLFLPVPRTDLLTMLALQDRVANKAKDIAGLVYGRKMQLPAVITDHFMEFLKRCLDASRQAQKAIDELDELFEAGFHGNEVKLIEDMLVELDMIEHDTDGIQIEIRQQLFDIEQQLPPINVIFLYKIIEWTGDLADYSHNIGEQLLLLLAR